MSFREVGRGPLGGMVGVGVVETGDAEPLAPRVAEAAINALTRRKFNVAACTSSEARVIPEAEAAAPPPAAAGPAS